MFTKTQLQTFYLLKYKRKREKKLENGPMLASFFCIGVVVVPLLADKSQSYLGDSPSANNGKTRNDITGIPGVLL